MHVMKTRRTVIIDVVAAPMPAGAPVKRYGFEP